MEQVLRRGISAQNQVITSGQKATDFGGVVPKTPEVFEQDMATSAFTHRNDAPEVVRLQGKIFHEKVTTCKELFFQWLSSGEVERLVEALPHYKAQSKWLGCMTNREG